MTSEVVMPRLGWTMEVGQLVEWLKRDGEPVEAGEIIFTVESDKAVTEVEALDSGVLRIPPDSPGPGVATPVGAVLAYLVPEGEPVPFESDPGVVVPPAAVHAAAAASTSSQASSSAGENGRSGRRTTPEISPRARRIADELGIDWTTLLGSGATGRIVERDVRASASRPRPIQIEPRATPVVRRLAAEHGVDLGQIAAGQPGGRVSRADVVHAVRPLPQPTPTMDDVTLVQPSSVRHLVAARMAESARTVAPVTLTTDVDATELVRLRTHLKTDLVGSDDPVPSINDLLVRIVALALRDHPALNASLRDDGIVHHRAVHIGLAVDTERGLYVPVVRDADRKSVGEIARDRARLVADVRSGTIAGDDLRGGTFTISNLGMFGIDAFTPIVNLPECAILGLGRIVPRPVVVDEAAETVAVRKMMALSLTFDHRLVDGAPAARFLQRVTFFVEHPYVWLTR